MLKKVFVAFLPIMVLFLLAGPRSLVGSAAVLAKTQAVNASARTNRITLTVKGNQVITPSGKPYIPEGISIYGGLEESTYAINLNNIDAQIKAAATYWHANTIRLQVAESNLFSGLKSGETYNVSFMNELIREVTLSRRLNMAVVINDQTEFTNNTPNPTAMTARFWKIVGNEFANRPYIIFDLFNEPRLLNATNSSQTTYNDRLIRVLLNAKIKRHARSVNRPHLIMKLSQIWSVWKYGGTVGGVKYLGMQTLINQIRSHKINNLIWAEGPFWGQRLPYGKYLLAGNNIEYSFHHINLNRISAWKFIGQLAASRPVVDGEWSQYQSPWQECYRSAPVNVPKYLNYLKQHNVGVIAWSLQAGSLLKGDPRIIPANNNSANDRQFAYQLRTPSRFSQHYACNDQFGQGAGQLILNYFSLNSHSV